MPRMLLHTTICPARWPSPPISVDITVEDTACGDAKRATNTAVSTGVITSSPRRAAKNSMEKHRLNGVDKYLGEDKEFQVLYAKEYLKSHPDINYFMFGHRHIELDLMLTHSCRLMILGDWIAHYTYAVFDGKTLTSIAALPESGDWRQFPSAFYLPLPGSSLQRIFFLSANLPDRNAAGLRGQKKY